MKISSEKREARPASVAKAGKPDAGASTRAGAQGSPAAVADLVSVMDIPAAEFTPKVRAAIMSLMAEVEKLRRELGQSQSRIQHLEQIADQDTLAPVFNRRAFVRELSRTMSYTQRYNTPASIIYIDVNGLKRINDTHGHGAGDAALSMVARTLLDNVRSSDVVGRLGGDEFGVILANADLPAATEKASALADAVKRMAVNWNGNPITVTLSHGVSALSRAQDATEALDEADRAMYRRKRADSAAGGS